MTIARKFAFETEFAPDGTIVRDAPSARRFTAQEVEAEKLTAYNRGQSDAVAAAEKASAKALADLAAKAASLLQGLDGQAQAMRAEAAELAIVAARAIAGAALETFGEERTLAAIESVMDTLRHGPRLIVRLPAAQVETLAPRIEALSTEQHYPGAVLVKPDSKLKAGAIEIDWTDGIVSIDPDEITARIQALVEAALNGAESGETP